MHNITFTWKKLWIMVIWMCQGNLHIIKKEHLIMPCWVLPIVWFHLNHCWVRWFSFHIKTINSSNINRKISMINEKIKKSFLNILSPPFLMEIWQSPNLLNAPNNNVACIINYVNWISKLFVYKKRRVIFFLYYNSNYIVWSFINYFS